MILNRRLVISQGDVRKKGRIHIDGPTNTPQNPNISVTPNPNTPVQQVWWTPFANLPALGEFKKIGVQRAPIDSWNEVLVTLVSDVERAAKIAVQVYAVFADADSHAADKLLDRSDIFKLHTNDGAAGAVILTLPNAGPGLRSAELYIEVKAAQPLLIRPRLGGANPDTLLEDGNDRTEASAAAIGERLVIKWGGPNVWRVAEATAGWAFT